MRAKLVNEAIKHLKPRTTEELAKLPPPKVYETIDDVYDELTPEEQDYVDTILDASHKIYNLFIKGKFERWGGWNGMMMALDEYEKKHNIKFDGFIERDDVDIMDLLMNEIKIK